MAVERIQIEANGITFKAKVYAPSDLALCKGVIVFTHGLGYCDRQYELGGESFAANGYLLISYNMRGHAGTAGKWRLLDAAADLNSIIVEIQRKYSFKNSSRVCAIGHSTGALVTLLASLSSDLIKFASLVTTVTCLRDSYLHWFKSGFNVSAKDYFKTKGVVPPIIEKFMDDQGMLEKYVRKELREEDLNIPHRYGLLSSDSWNDFFHEIACSPDILKKISILKVPVLLFRGEYDEVMDVVKTNQLYESLDKRLPSKLYLTDSHNHFHNDRWAMIQDETHKFFNEFCDYSASAESFESCILIIDDDSLVLRTLASALKKNGYKNIDTALSGEEALRLFDLKNKERGKGYDFVIADIRMPGIDGIETVRKMKEMMGEEQNKKFPFVFVTGYEGGRTQVEAKSLGYVDYFHKPIDLNAFVGCVKKFVKV
ncbi:MAG TPA: alpha/beta fold hydrolase [Candidatus Omnitrophota bacterium]|nr:alpha/beta fold hydrolase [Candidatus Omnitrophota bacterium]